MLNEAALCTSERAQKLFGSFNGKGLNYFKIVNITPFERISNSSELFKLFRL